MRKPKIALALGAGGVKGVAHVGVLKVFEENGIPIDIIAGASMGAIVGGCYAAGVSIESLEKTACRLRQSQLIDFGLLASKHGFIKGNRAEKLISRVLQTNHAAISFRGCKIPFACVATDLLSGKTVIMKKGKLARGIRASFSIAGAFRPVKINKMFLVDGGPLVRVPVRLAKQMGADIVIAVDVVGETDPIAPEVLDSLSSTITRVFYIMDYQVSKPEISEADHLIEIKQPNVNPLKIRDAQKSIEKGYETTKNHIDAIKKLINDWKPIRKSKKIENKLEKNSK